MANHQTKPTRPQPNPSNFGRSPQMNEPTPVAVAEPPTPAVFQQMINSDQSNKVVQSSPYAWVVEQENYLISKGWERNGSDRRGISTWNDPAGTMASPEEVVQGTLPDKDSKTEREFKQIVGPPIPWTYNLEEAIDVQRNRDRAAEAKRMAAQKATEEKAAAEVGGPPK